MLDLLAGLGRFSHFALRSLFASTRALRRPREAIRQLHHIYVGALPLGLAAGLALGVVIWLHLHGVLARFGPGNTALLPQALALAVALELAPTGGGFLVAARSGAGLAAELASMRLTEQVDALEVLGLSPMDQLVGPRVLACMVALPLLTVHIAVLALLGGYLAELTGGNLSWTQYWNESLRGLTLEDVVPATLKTVVFGYLVAATGCNFGMTAQGGTEGVGQAATRGVVVSIFLVVVSNVLLVAGIRVLQ